MTVNGDIDLAWGDGEHRFNITKIGLALELEEKCRSGVREIYQRLVERRWFLNDRREPIRLGLIGGGKSPVEALALVKRYVDERPWAESVTVAQAILAAAIVGVEGDNPTKKAGADQTPESGSTTTTAGSSDPPSMDSAPA